MRKDTHLFTTNCARCQLTKKSSAPKRALLQSLDIPTEAFTSIHLDFFPAPLNAQKEDNVFVIVDKSSKIAELSPCKRTSSAIEVADLFFKNWLCRGYPLPKTIFSDRDSKFISAFWKQLMVSMGVKLQLPTARHQQTNGSAEHVVKQAKICLRALGRPQKWRDDLPAITFALNSAVHSTTGFSPFHLALGLDPSAQNPWQPFARDKTILDQAIANSLHKNDQAEVQYNRKATAYEKLAVKDWVLLDREGLNWPPDSNESQPYLTPKIGPFQIIEAQDFNNYKLKLPSTWKIHPVFAREKLTVFHGTPPSPDPLPTPEADPKEHFEVEKILNAKIERNKLKALIQWVGYTDPTWEPLSNLDNCRDKIDNFLLLQPQFTEAFRASNQQVRGSVISPRSSIRFRLGLGLGLPKPRASIRFSESRD